MMRTVSTEARKSVFVTLVEVMKSLAAASSLIFWMCVTVWVIRVTMSHWVKSQESHCAVWPPSSFYPSMPNRDVTVLSIFLSGLWQKCLDVVVDIWRCQTKTRDKELQLFFLSRNKEQREVGTTVTICPCVPSSFMLGTESWKLTGWQILWKCGCFREFLQYADTPTNHS